MGWLSVVPRKVWFVVLGSILAAGALFWAHHAGYKSGRIDEQLANDQQRVDTAKVARNAAARAVDSVKREAKPVFVRAAALHDSVKVADTTTVVITLPALNSVSTKQNVEIPAIIVRRIVQDSIALRSKDAIIERQAAQIVTDSSLVGAQQDEINTLRDMKSPVCGAKCKAGVAVLKVVVVAESAVRIVRWLKPRR